MAQLSNEGDPKKLQPLTVPKIMEQLERALIDIKYNQSGYSELAFNQSENEPINSKNNSRQEFIGKELMLFEMIGVLNGKISELQKKYDKIKAIEEKQEEFVSEKANEITQPIQDIIDYAKLAKSGHLEHEEAWENILEITKKLQNVSTVVLDTNRVENNSLKLFTKIQKVNELILECISSVKNQTQVPVNVGLDHDVEIQIDRLRLSQVIQTILNNSIKNTVNGYIKVESFVAHEQHAFILRICDTGKGIPKEKIETIFEKGSQINQKRLEASTNLGLYLCKGIVEAHDGKIFVKNNVDRGCTITITLPLK